jgi:prophage regulatory protein
MESEILLRLPEVERRTGLRRAHLYKLARNGAFPKPLKISARASAWRASEVSSWIAAKVTAAELRGAQRREAA